MRIAVVLVLLILLVILLMAQKGTGYWKILHPCPAAPNQKIRMVAELFRRESKRGKYGADLVSGKTSLLQKMHLFYACRVLVRNVVAKSFVALPDGRVNPQLR